MFEYENQDFGLPISDECRRRVAELVLPGDEQFLGPKKYWKKAASPAKEWLTRHPS